MDKRGPARTGGRLELARAGARERPDGARAELCPAEDPHGGDDRLDAGFLERPGQFAPLRQDGDRGEAGAVEAAGEQQQLAVGAVAARR